MAVMVDTEGEGATIMIVLAVLGLMVLFVQVCTGIYIKDVEKKE